MKLFEKLTDENFTMFAMQCYDNPQCTSMEEFMEDLRRFRYLKRLLRRYYKNGGYGSLHCKVVKTSSS